MSTNKEAYLRYKIIDACITNKYKPYPSMDEIIEACEEKIGKTFSVSTLQKDIKALKEDEVLGFLAPIKFSKRFNGYYYSDKTYSIRNIPLNETDIDALLMATDLLSSFNGNRVSANFGHAVDKILTASKEVYDKSLDKRQIVQTEKAPKQRGLDNFDSLFTATKTNTVVNFIHYNYQKRQFKSIILHPYLLKEFQNRWYIIGYSENHNAFRTFGLDRIMDLYSLKHTFTLLKNFNAETYFNKTYGVYPLGDKLEKIEFETNVLLSDYLLSQPIHESQSITHYFENGRLLIELELIVSQELINLFQMHSKNIKVLKPEWLVTQLNQNKK